MNDFAMGYGGDEGTVAFLRKKLRKNLEKDVGDVRRAVQIPNRPPTRIDDHILFKGF